MDKMAWIDRKFQLDLPAWMFPNVIERVRGTPARVEDAVENIPEDVLRRRLDGTWSIQENIGHLLTLESLWSTRLTELIAGRPILTAWEETNRASWDARYNEQPLRTILDEFRAERTVFVRRLEEVDDAVIERSALHPRLKTPMRTIDLAFFVAEHDDYHLARMSFLRRTFA